MRSAYSLGSLSAEEIWIGLAPDELPRILPYRVIERNAFEIRHGEKARHIGIVHEIFVAESVHLEGINLSELRMIHNCIFLQGRLHLGSEGTAFLREFLLPVHSLENLGSLTQCADSKEIGRNQEIECGSVVGRTE